MNAIINIFSIILLLLGSYVIYKEYRKRRLSFQVIARAALIVFILGVVIYLIGYSGSESVPEGGRLSFLSLVGMSVISSLRMFFLDPDISQVAPVFRESVLYVTLYSIILICAVAVSGAFLIYLFGSWFRSRILWFWAQKERQQEKIRHIHIFFDFGENSALLAKDILENSGQGDGPSKDSGYGFPKGEDLIIFFDPGSDEDESEGVSIERIFSREAYRMAPTLKGGISSIIVRKTAVKPWQYDGKSLIKDLELGRLLRNRGKTLHFYFLSNDENRNIASTLAIRDNFQEEKNGDKAETLSCNVVTYCHASQNRSCDALEYIDTSKINGADRSEEGKSENGNPSFNIVIVDSAFLAVHYLRKTHSFHPVNFIDIDTENALAQSPFNSLIIGFGQTGQEALRFLSEFGRFVYEDAPEGKFLCTAIDKDMDSLKGRFLAETPYFRKKESGVTFKQEDSGSDEFWNNLKKSINELNYIVITSGSDENDISLAEDIYQFALRYRKNLNHFIIAVRGYMTENTQRMKVISEVNIGGNSDDIIKVFGVPEDIFKKEMVHEDMLLCQAKEFHMAYEKITNPSSFNPKEDYWGKRRNDAKTPLEKMDLVRKESQDFSNADHIYTKMKLIEGKSISSYYDWDSVDDIVTELDSEPWFENLSRLEHLRWNSALYAMGYETMTPDEYKNLAVKCDVRRKKHLCLIPWEDLGLIKSDARVPESQKNNPVQYFDKAVVITTLSIGRQDMHKENQGKEDVESILDEKRTYTPHPVDTSDVAIPEELLPLLENIALNVHENWSSARIGEGWKYGEKLDREKMEHPCLVPYEELSEDEKDYDRMTSQQTLKLILKLGFEIKKVK